MGTVTQSGQWEHDNSLQVWEYSMCVHSKVLLQSSEGSYPGGVEAQDGAAGDFN